MTGHEIGSGYLPSAQSLVIGCVLLESFRILLLSPYLVSFRDVEISSFTRSLGCLKTREVRQSHAFLLAFALLAFSLLQYSSVYTYLPLLIALSQFFIGRVSGGGANTGSQGGILH